MGDEPVNELSEFHIHDDLHILLAVDPTGILFHQVRAYCCLKSQT